MNKVLEEILSTGYTSTPEGQAIKVHGNIDQRKCIILTHLIQKFKPIISLEIGLAYGVSAIAICDALPKTAHSRHFIIDPHQNIKPVWGGIGLYNLNRAGFRNLIEFYEQPSYRMLPLLDSKHIKIDFAFIDGWHTFDYTLVDFFYIDKMLKVGGTVVFDDADWPAVRNVCRFIATNLEYSVYNLPDEFETDKEPALQHHSKFYLHTIVDSLSKLLYSFRGSENKTSIISKDNRLGLRGNFIIFKKEGEDKRKWNHFIPF
ncbi:MAG: hypothetical protein A3J42_02010 [Candidatus Dadabacteria bacterium RIFCSPHIGHO2_12_FULL_53_21]|nr:MAG: hypothetical protein A3J42_02010 [Candidatus Dadabacteria bacterium RIFCSPHIGHO2_12_FULL_53_21]